MASQPKNRAKLTITFEDGSTKEIVMEKAIEIKVPEQQEICFRPDKNGNWSMIYYTDTFEGKKLAIDFLTVNKIV